MKTEKRDSLRAAFVKVLAEKHGLSRRQIDRIVEGESDNEEVYADYMDLRQGTNALIEAVKNLVPFN